MSGHHYIACDLGADSGRVIVGSLNEGKISLEEVHRFPTGVFKIGESLRWNILRIFEDIKTGLKKAAVKNVAAESLSVDSWGVDYVLFNTRQPMLGLPHQYRDSRTDGPYASVRKALGDEQIFAQTGIQFLPFNTIYQLAAELEKNGDLLAIADKFLTIADYLNYLLSGAAVMDESLASTTQLYNPKTRQWAQELICALGLPGRIFPPIVKPGVQIGSLLPYLQEETGLGAIPVCATCSHDTGAAVAAVPAEGSGWAYLSSGTWSLIGVELPEPLINEEVRRQNFTNEAGYGGTTRFLKNIVGLWLLQESRRDWIRQGMRLSFDDLDVQANASEPFRSLINPNAERFLKPGNMPAKIADYCRETGQPVPETPGQVTRCIFESLALFYRQMHIVGGGSQSKLLNQFAASGTGRQVFAGPVEATACGNILIQALALGHLDSLEALRAVVRASFQVAPYQPQDGDQWAAAFDRFSRLTLCQ